MPPPYHVIIRVPAGQIIVTSGVHEGKPCEIGRFDDKELVHAITEHEQVIAASDKRAKEGAIQGLLWNSDTVTGKVGEMVLGGDSIEVTLETE